MTPPELEDLEPCRVYLDERLERYALVDWVDYHWAVTHRWCIKKSHRDRKGYARRAVGLNRGGKRLKTFTLYLHVEIMKRTGVPPKHPGQVLVDHLNRDTLDCRRANLRWACSVLNNRNHSPRLARASAASSS